MQVCHWKITAGVNPRPTMWDKYKLVQHTLRFGFMMLVGDRICQHNKIVCKIVTKGTAFVHRSWGKRNIVFPHRVRNLFCHKHRTCSSYLVFPVDNLSISYKTPLGVDTLVWAFLRR